MTVKLKAQEAAEYEKLQREGIAAMREGNHEIANDYLARVWSFFAQVKSQYENAADTPRILKA